MFFMNRSHCSRADNLVLDLVLKTSNSAPEIQRTLCQKSSGARPHVQIHSTVKKVDRSATFGEVATPKVLHDITIREKKHACSFCAVSEPSTAGNVTTGMTCRHDQLTWYAGAVDAYGKDRTKGFPARKYDCYSLFNVVIDNGDVKLAVHLARAVASTELAVEYVGYLPGKASQLHIAAPTWFMKLGKLVNNQDPSVVLEMATIELLSKHGLVNEGSDNARPAQVINPAGLQLSLWAINLTWVGAFMF